MVLAVASFFLFFKDAEGFAGEIGTKHIFGIENIERFIPRAFRIGKGVRP